MDKLNCQSCGACCGHYLVEVLPSEVNPSILQHIQSKTNEKTGVDEFFLKRHRSGRCTALSGTIGECVSCSIYEFRPVECSVFEPGGADCLESRIKFGI